MEEWQEEFEVDYKDKKYKCFRVVTTYPRKGYSCQEIKTWATLPEGPFSAHDGRCYSRSESDYMRSHAEHLARWELIRPFVARQEKEAAEKERQEKLIQEYIGLRLSLKTREKRYRDIRRALYSLKRIDEAESIFLKKNQKI